MVREAYNPARSAASEVGINGRLVLNRVFPHGKDGDRESMTDRERLEALLRNTEQTERLTTEMAGEKLFPTADPLGKPERLRVTINNMNASFKRRRCNDWCVTTRDKETGELFISLVSREEARRILDEKLAEARTRGAKKKSSQAAQTPDEKPKVTNIRDYFNYYQEFYGYSEEARNKIREYVWTAATRRILTRVENGSLDELPADPTLIVNEEYERIHPEGSPRLPIVLGTIYSEDPKQAAKEARAKVVYTILATIRSLPTQNIQSPSLNQQKTDLERLIENTALIYHSLLHKGITFEDIARMIHARFDSEMNAPHHNDHYNQHNGNTPVFNEALLSGTPHSNGYTKDEQKGSATQTVHDVCPCCWQDIRIFADPRLPTDAVRSHAQRTLGNQGGICSHANGEIHFSLEEVIANTELEKSFHNNDDMGKAEGSHLPRRSKKSA